MMEMRFRQRPRDLDRATFVATFGRVYEQSPWVAEILFRRGLDASHDSLEGLADAFYTIVEEGGETLQLALLRAHPDLAGRLALAGGLTLESRGEQSGAGLDQCSPAEYHKFQELNAAYGARFGFPFIMAVKGKSRAEILAAFEQRIHNEPATEFRAALEQVHRIAYLRLRDLC